MTSFIYAPIAAAVILGFLVQIQDLSEQTSERTLEYAQDAVAALDCAYEARPITDCSPNIVGEDFKEEIEATNKLLEQIQAEQAVYQEP